MSILEDVEVIWCNYAPGMDLGVLGEFQQVTSLGLWGDVDADERPVVDCAGLGRAHDLMEIEIGGLECRSLEPLSDLPRLENLRISVERPEHLMSVGRIVSLTDLKISGSALEDPRALSGLVNLERLIVSGEPSFQDLRPLAGLGGLREIHAQGTSVSDLGPLHALSLERLYLGRTHVADLTPLSASMMLSNLSVPGTRVKSLAPLADLPRLRRLDISSTEVSDISPLAGLERLETLDAACLDLAPRQLEALQRARPGLEIRTGDSRGRCSQF